MTDVANRYLDYPPKPKGRGRGLALALAAVALVLLGVALPRLWRALDTAIPGGSTATEPPARTPYEAYTSSLRQAGLYQSALTQDWLRAGHRVLNTEVEIETPFQEAGYLDPDAAEAVAYRVNLTEGQMLVVNLRLEADSTARVFIDLFRDRPSGGLPLRVASAEAGSRRLEYEASVTDTYVVRLQPELLRGGRYLVTILKAASLGFPVSGRDVDAIRSGFGAPRDGGRRRHHGVDIFANRWTPVLAATDGLARAGTNRLGGNVVWLRDANRNRFFYYAHLEQHAFAGRFRVQRGDTLGWVGNSGNARTTPPHLHFGVYWRGRGPTDPYHYLYDPPSDPVRLTADTSVVGMWARARARPGQLRPKPSRRVAPVTAVQPYTALRVLGGTGGWFRVELPGGQTGFVPASVVESLERPLRSEVLELSAPVLANPSPAAAVTDSLPSGEALAVFARFGGFAMVKRPNGRWGWLEPSAIPGGPVAAN